MGTRDKHLDPKNENSCEYIDVKCTHGCEEDMEKYELAEHLNRFCPKRPHKCEHCDFEDVFDRIVKDHIPVCPKYPLPCHNNCGNEEIPRSDYEQHLSECPHQDIECEFRYAGCVERIKRKDIAQHQQEGVYVHLSLQTAFATHQLTERDRKIEEMATTWENKHQHLTEKLFHRCEEESKEREENFKRLKVELAQKDEAIERLSAQLHEKEKVIESQEDSQRKLSIKIDELSRSVEVAKDTVRKQIKEVSDKSNTRADELFKDLGERVKAVEESLTVSRLARKQNADIATATVQKEKCRPSTRISLGREINPVPCNLVSTSPRLASPTNTASTSTVPVSLSLEMLPPAPAQAIPGGYKNIRNGIVPLPISEIGQDTSGTKNRKGAFQTKEDSAECPICLSGFKDPVITKCGHVFCRGCIDQALQLCPYCPSCKTALRRIVGNQPIDGKMLVKYSKSKLLGHYDCGTIEIHYEICDGTQGMFHPHPGRSFQGAYRIAYLPNNPEGGEVLQLLKRAFDARLIFTVGTSITSGQNDVVTWNDIHHKTSTHGGPYGYPDPTYLARVKADLAAKGIVTDKK